MEQIYWKNADGDLVKKPGNSRRADALYVLGHADMREAGLHEPDNIYEVTGAEETARMDHKAALNVGGTKAALRAAFIAEGLSRITAQVPAWESLEKIDLLASVWNMLGAPSAAQTAARNVYVYVKQDGLPRVTAMTTLVELQAVDPTAADPFGDGADPWPT